MLDFQRVFERKREEVGERALSNVSFVKTYSCILFKKKKALWLSPIRLCVNNHVLLS